MAKRRAIRATKSGSFEGFSKKNRRRGKPIARTSRKTARELDLLVARRRSHSHKRKRSR